jgi:hypothetical protein
MWYRLVFQNKNSRWAGAELHYAHGSDCHRTSLQRRGPSVCPATRQMCHFIDWRVRRSTQRHKPKSVKDRSRYFPVAPRAIYCKGSNSPSAHAPRFLTPSLAGLFWGVPGGGGGVAVWGCKECESTKSYAVGVVCLCEKQIPLHTNHSPKSIFCPLTHCLQVAHMHALGVVHLMKRSERVLAAWCMGSWWCVLWIRSSYCPALSMFLGEKRSPQNRPRQQLGSCCVAVLPSAVSGSTSRVPFLESACAAQQE